jgi:hypothetical protein
MTFSWAFYLSGAGWVDFSTGSYSVSLDCGGQPLGTLTAPCILDGTAYSEMVGDVVFDRYVKYDPTTGLLSGTASTYVWVYDFSSIVLPLLPTEFVEGKRFMTDHAKSLTLSGGYLHSGLWSWQISFWPTAGTPKPYNYGDLIDLSHASIYRVEIRDPDGGTTTIDDFDVVPNIPSVILGTVAGTVREKFCTDNPGSPLCPDFILSATNLKTIPTAMPMIANGADAYDFILKLRDRYGNAVTEGQIRVDYRDNVRTLQVDSKEYGGYSADDCYLPACALLTTGDLSNDSFGTPTTGDLPLSGLSALNYSISSIAPTSLTDTLSLSWILYTDSLWVMTDIAPASWKSSLSFDPWYTTGLSAWPMIIGKEILFTTSYTHATTTAPLPAPSTAIYDIRIWSSNMPSAFQDFTWPRSCVKYTGVLWTSECSWFPPTHDPVIISTDATIFSGTYSFWGYDPLPEMVSYKSYIRYATGGTTVIYPSLFWDLSMSIAGTPRMKILGQHNLGSISWVQEKNIANVWNTLRKNIALLSRNRTSYTDVDYTISNTDLTLSDSDFASKRTIVTIGWDIMITSDIVNREYPIAIIALMDADGHGGDITISPSVRDISATLFAEKSVKSSGSDQLYVRGSVISHNTVSDSSCPYYVSPCVNPKYYNLENIRKDFLTTPGSLSSLLVGRESTIPLVIEYDGRVLTDPPPILEK